MRILYFFLSTCAVAAMAAAPGPLLEVNRGQFSPGVAFRAKAQGVAIDITASGLVFRAPAGRIGLHFDGARASTCAPLGKAQSQSNYLAVTPPITDVPLYSSIV